MKMIQEDRNVLNSGVLKAGLNKNNFLTLKSEILIVGLSSGSEVAFNDAALKDSIWALVWLKLSLQYG